jgi:hypothetical protein
MVDVIAWARTISRPGAGSASLACLAAWASASVVARTCFARSSWRADLLAFLRDATQPGHAPSTSARRDGGMMGVMGGGAVPNLKKLDPDGRVQKITHPRHLPSDDGG